MFGQFQLRTALPGRLLTGGRSQGLVIHYRDAVQETQLEELRRWGDEYLANEDQQEHCRKEFDKDKVMRRIEPDTVVLALLEALEKHPSGDHGGPEMKP